MLRRLFVASALALLLFPATSRAQFKQGDWELTLGGSGANGPDFDGFNAQVNGSLGYFLTDQFEVGIRQSIGYNDIGVPGSDIAGSTRVAIDYHFDLGRVQPFVGGNIGFVYGDAVNDTWEAAPEAGVKFFANATTFIYFSAEYQFFFDENSDAGSAFSDGQFIYGLGIGFRF